MSYGVSWAAGFQPLDGYLLRCLWPSQLSVCRGLAPALVLRAFRFGLLALVLYRVSGLQDVQTLEPVPLGSWAILFGLSLADGILLSCIYVWVLDGALRLLASLLALRIFAS